MNLNDPAQFLEVAAVSRPNHTPELRCTALLKGLEDHAVVVFGDGGRAFFHSMAQSLWDGEFKGVGGDDFIAGLMREYDGQQEDAFRLPRDYFHLAAGMAYAIKAIHTWRDGKKSEAWDLAFDAAQHDGLLSGMLFRSQQRQPLPSSLDWQLIEPTRGDILSRVMFDTLKAAKVAGHHRPNVSQLFNQWMASKPPQFVVVMASGVTLINEDDQEQTFTPDQVKDRYKRLVGQKLRSGGGKKGR